MPWSCWLISARNSKQGYHDSQLEARNLKHALVHSRMIFIQQEDRDRKSSFGRSLLVNMAKICLDDNDNGQCIEDMYGA